MTRLRSFARRLLDRFRPAYIPDDWTAEAFADIRARWNEPLTGELPTIETTAEIIILDPDLGPLLVADMTPVRPVFFDQLRDLRPVDLNWQPSWTVA